MSGLFVLHIPCCLANIRIYIVQNHNYQIHCAVKNRTRSNFYAAGSDLFVLSVQITLHAEYVCCSCLML